MKTIIKNYLTLFILFTLVGCSSFGKKRSEQIQKDNQINSQNFQDYSNSNGVKRKSLFADHKSYSKGDIITIIITEEATAQSSAKSSTNKSFSNGFQTNAGQGPMSFIPLASVGAEGANTSAGDAKTSRSGTLETKITARIMYIDSNGNLKIKGEKFLVINGEREKTTIEGYVRPQDISSDNKVYSFNVADAKISYSGKGAVKDGSKVGFISRVFNFLF